MNLKGIYSSIDTTKATKCGYTYHSPIDDRTCFYIQPDIFNYNNISLPIIRLNVINSICKLVLVKKKQNQVHSTFNHTYKTSFGNKIVPYLRARSVFTINKTSLLLTNCDVFYDQCTLREIKAAIVLSTVFSVDRRFMIVVTLLKSF